MLEGLMKWISGGNAKAITGMSDLREGGCVLEGRLQGEETIISPASSIPCLAFYYRATYLAASRVKKSVRRRLRDALCYAPSLTLELDGGSISLISKNTEVFTAEEHRVLLEMGAEGIKVREDRIVANTRVRVSGKLKKDKGDPTAWTMVFQELAAVEGDDAKQVATRPDRNSARSSRKKVKAKRANR